MAEKRRIKKTIKHLQRFKTWQLLILLILAGFLSATFLRLNNIGMLQRREAVIEADKAGDEQQLRARLYDLREYSVNHMNSDTGQFQLEGQYKRAVKRVNDDIVNQQSKNNPNSGIYNEVMNLCKPHYTIYSNPYYQCIMRELDKLPPAQNIEIKAKLPKASAFMYNYASPLWSADFAGFSVLLVGIIALLIVIRLISLAVLNLLLYHRYKSI